MEEPKSVSEYTREIKRLLESRIEPCWIKGEVSNFRKQSSGHLYFSLKDGGAQLPAVMFRGDARRLEFKMDNGVEVLAFGNVSVYEPHGRYQLIVRSMNEAGAGRLHLEFERLKKRLQAEGLFDAARKRPLPALPLRIAFVTSPSGAAVQDFIRILKRRDWPGRLSVIPAKVQGKGAAEEIVAALDFIEREGCYDLAIVGRGGGSLEDLWCFNEESVARRIAKMETPIISAVGHEIDFTLSDFAADVRAETPSSAAELITSLALEMTTRLSRAEDLLEGSIDYWLGRYGEILEGLQARFRSRSPRSAVEHASLRLDDLAARMDASVAETLSGRRERLLRAAARLGGQDPGGKLALIDQQLDSLAGRWARAADQAVVVKKGRLEKVADALEIISPQATLNRGYAVLLDEEGRTLSSEKDVPAGGLFEAALKDGRLKARRSGG